MRNLIDTIIRYRPFTIFFVLLVVVLGLISYYYIPKQDSPDVTPSIAIISTVYPGASPEDVEKLVTRPIEDEVTGIKGYKYSRSISQDSASVVILELVNETDVDKAWADLRQMIQDIQPTLPEECYPTEINTNLAETAGLILSLSGPDYTYEQLSSMAEDLKRELSRIEGVSRMELKGQLAREIKVTVNTSELNQYAVSLEDIYNLLRIQNMEIPSGAIETEDVRINVKTPGIFTSIEDIENTIVTVSRETGALVRLKDIAQIDWALEDSSYKLRHQGENAVLLIGYFGDEKNIVLIGQEVRAELEDLKTKIPPGVIVSEITFQPEDVDRSVNSFFLNLVGGMILVLVVVLIGMGIRNALVASTAVPLSILLTFTAMNLTGIKVHEISIAALIISLGILVDNAIVVIDGIQNYLDQGMERRQACIQGTRESVLPIFSATLIATLAFVPIYIVPGPAGEYMNSIPYMILFSLFASFLVAILFIPAMAFMTFTRTTKSKKEKVSRFRLLFASGLDKALQYKKIPLFLIGAVFLLSFILLKFIPLQFFPLADKNMAYIDLYSEKTSDIRHTEALTAEVEEFLKSQPEIIAYTSAVGDGLPKFYLTVPTASPSRDFAQIMFTTDLSQSDRFNKLSELAVYLQEELDQRLVTGKATVQLLAKAYPGAPLEIRIMGEDRQQLLTTASSYTDTLRKLPGTINVEDDADEAIYEFTVDVDSDKATNMGVTKYDIQRQINIALKGSQPSVYRKAGNEYAIIVKSDISAPEELANLAIKSSITDQKVLLKQFATIKLNSVYPSIKKYDAKQCVTVSSYLQPGYSAVELEQALKEEMQNQNLDLEEVEIIYEGETKDIVDNFSELGFGAIYALLGIYIILMLQFSSFRQPLIILGTVPLSLIGVFLGLFLFRQPLSFTALVGGVSLMGLVIKNGILLIEYMNTARECGQDIETACKGALQRRYRPIILSSVTTVFGLIPLMLSGSALFVPMSVALMTGLLVSTLLTLIFIPLLYRMVEEKKDTVTIDNYKNTGIGI
ncbi:MAG: transporter [Gracilibacter sp. BRH_c7a]|nr:MAG: transporter [Gracilibacter sp. BRH_c7a]